MDDELYERMERAQAEFHDRAMTIPGVHATSIGMKSVAGEMTPTFAIIVHTTRKRPLEDVPEAERVPDQLGGFPTDVVESDPPVPAAVDYIEGGATVAVLLHGEGTLGCMVNDNVDSTPCLLSNAHVLKSVGTTVYIDKADECHRVGQTKRLVNNDTVDAAIATIGKTAYSCQIANIGAVEGTKPATLGANVRKMGRTTRLTSGFIAEVNYQGLPGKNQPWQDMVLLYPNWDDKSRKFADFGDSGSAIVDDNGYVLGLIWGITVITRYDQQKITCGVACKISNVEAALQVTVATAVGADAPQSPAETFTGRLEALCKPSMRTQAYFDAYMRYGDQIRHLFHENARLYRLWLSSPQEAFMDAFEDGVYDPSKTIPATLDGQDTAGVLTQLRDGLSQYVEDPTLKRQLDGLCADLSGSVGRTWQEAVAKTADSSAQAPGTSSA